MNRDCSWKRTEEVEIDLLDLLYRLRIQWKRILACALICAVLAGGGSFLFSGNSSKETIDTTVEKSTVQTNTTVQAPLTKEEQEQAKQLREEIDALEQYLENSILMRADPYHKNSRNLLFVIEGAQSWKLQKIAESYLNFLTYEVAGAVKNTDSSMEYIDNSYLAELITAAQKTNTSYQEADAGQMLSGVFLQVGVVGKDAKMAEQLAADIQEVLEDYHLEVEKECGSHTLSLLDCAAGEKVDHTLLAQQREKRTLLTTERASLKTFDRTNVENQDTAEQTKANVQTQGSATENQTTAAEVVEPTQQEKSVSVIAVLLGFLGGMLIYCAGYACWYMLRDAIRSEGEFKAHYAIPFYGSISTYKENAASSDGWEDADQQELKKLLHRIRLSCEKQGIKKICLATDASFRAEKKGFLDVVFGQLQEWGIEAEQIENLSETPDLWDSDVLAQTEAVVLVCRLGATTYHMVDDTVEFCLENEITVLGAAALK